jgi:FG-GAP-like repeat
MTPCVPHRMAFLDLSRRSSATRAVEGLARPPPRPFFPDFPAPWLAPGISFGCALKPKQAQPGLIEPGQLVLRSRPSPQFDQRVQPQVAVDWDGDGHLDLVVGNFSGRFYWFKGEGKGRFRPKPEILQSAPVSAFNVSKTWPLAVRGATFRRRPSAAERFAEPSRSAKRAKN